MKALFALALAVSLVVVACQGEKVVEVVATPAPLPTLAPWPTHTPYPTLAPLPTSTPYPTYTPFPSRTPFLTPAVDRDKWVVYLSGTSESLVLAGADSGSLWGAWTLSLSCDPEERPEIYLNRVDAHIFDLDTAEAVDQVVLIDLDGVVSEQTWFYYPSEAGLSDQLASPWAGSIVGRLLDADRLTVTVPTDIDDYVVVFEVSGLARHLNEPQSLCGSPGGER